MNIKKSVKQIVTGSMKTMEIHREKESEWREGWTECEQQPTKGQRAKAKQRLASDVQC